MMTHLLIHQKRHSHACRRLLSCGANDWAVHVLEQEFVGRLFTLLQAPLEDIARRHERKDKQDGKDHASLFAVSRHGVCRELNELHQGALCSDTHTIQGASAPDNDKCCERGHRWGVVHTCDELKPVRRT